MIQKLINKHKNDKRDEHTCFQISYENKYELDRMLLELERIGLRWASNTLPTQKRDRYVYIPGYLQIDRLTERLCIRHSSDNRFLRVPTYTYSDVYDLQLPSKQSLMDFLGE